MASTILLVDDDPSYRELLAFGFSVEGFETVTARNGRDAIDKIGSLGVPDLVVVDYLMPVLDGMRFLTWLRHEKEASVPAILLTCVEQRAFAVEAMVVGAVDVLVKPVAFDVLLDRSRALLASRATDASTTQQPASEAT